MENFKGTSGAWVIYKFDGDVHITDESNIQSICKLPSKYEHTEANAKLIAASKDLLEALQDMLLIDELDEVSKHKTQMKAINAINKATL